MKIIDLRSDTVTKPSAHMRRRMAEAEVGDDVYGEDPTVNRLEELCARITGKESALFVPSGSMANLIAQLCYIQPGDEIIIGANSHCFRYEVGAGAAIAGAQYVVIEGDGVFTAEDVEKKIREPTFHTPGTSLVWIENTHNFGGGIVFPLKEIKRIKLVCEAHNLPLHMDGARVFNAAIASGVSVKEIASEVDSLSFCFSKGLGAPVGSVLCCSRQMRQKMHRFRKMLGGGMRQAGVLAAAAIYALENNVNKLKEDHINAKKLAEGLSKINGIKIDLATVQTNIVIAEITHPAFASSHAFVRELKNHGVAINPLTDKKIRFVTHMHIDRRDVEEVINIVQNVMK